jgi:hypothetical protein
MDSGLETIRGVVNEATLSVETRRTVLWGLDQLPPLYRDLDRTYDVRYRDSILRLVQGMLMKLQVQEPGCPDAPEVAEGIVSHLKAMHERLGIPSLGLKPPAPPKPVRKRKVKAAE